MLIDLAEPSLHAKRQTWQSATTRNRWIRLRVRRGPT
jgi:hypothetical protein